MATSQYVFGRPGPGRSFIADPTTVSSNERNSAAE